MRSLFSRNFILLWQGQFISKIGTFLFNIALILYIKEHTNSAAVISLILIAGNTPEIFLAPLGGTLADLFSRKKIIIFSDIISGIFIIGITGLIAQGIFSDSINLVLLFFLSLVLGLCGACFSPAVSALVPQLVDKKILHSANAMFQSTSQLSMVLGQAIGGLFYTKTGAVLLFFINGASFIISGFSEIFIRIEKTNPQQKKSWKDLNSQFKANFKDGFHYCRHNKQLQYLFLIIGIYHFFVAPLPILIPFWVSDVLFLNEQWTGFLFAGFAMGILVGFTIAGTVDFLSKNITKIITVLFLFSSVSFIIFPLFHSAFISILCLVCLGIIVGIVIVIHITFIQKITPQNFHGRVFGFLNTITNATIPIGLGIYGLVLDILNKTIGRSLSTSE